MCCNPYKVSTVCYLSHMLLVPYKDGHSVLLIIQPDVGALQGGHSVLLIISHDVGALQGGHSVLLIIQHDVGVLQGGHSVQFIIYNIVVLSKIVGPSSIIVVVSVCKKNTSKRCPHVCYIKRLCVLHVIGYFRCLWINLDRSMSLMRQHGGERMGGRVICHIFIQIVQI